MQYRIQQVSEKIEVPRSTIRFWETGFPELVRPERTNGGQRRYSEQDIGNLHKIKNLLHHQNRTIDQARIILKQGNTDTGKIDWQNQS
ncbi:MAG TPA: MerR family transcriptional regulator, partial [Desulfobacterales bacterium]|nr:MerR family transcriptional regulator [Desulfobacterales bacterium]